MPSTIGSYRITDVIGSGAMGVVYAGRHLGDGRAVAVKTVTKRDATRFSQIRREIRALARLDHPGVVHILDHGVDDSRPWYAMEHLQGISLRDVVANQSSPLTMARSSSTAATTLLLDDKGNPEQTETSEETYGDVGQIVSRDALGRLLAIIEGVCEALAYVHGEGVIHRDIKLSNIFILDNGQPVLVDFGLAEEIGGAVGREWIDHTQRISGSPAYMSPEQIRGEILDARSDLYSLGCVLYQLVTGHPPFVGSRRAIVRSHLDSQVLPPSAVIGGVPQALDLLIMGLLEKDRDRRTGYAENVAAALARLGASPMPWSLRRPAAKPYLYRSAFIGRQDLLKATNAFIARCRSGQGGMMVVAGESGAGKTRLALEAGILARRAGLEVLSGDCQPRMEDDNHGASSQAPPLFALRPLIEAVVDRCVELGEAEKVRLLGRYAPVIGDYFPMLRDALQVTEQPPPLQSAAARQRLFEALSFTLAAYADGRPLMLVLDDLQWADELTLGLLNHFKDGPLQAAPVLILTTFRSEERTAALDALFGAPEVSGYDLRRMAVNDVRGMVGGMLALTEPPPQLVDFLAGSSNGNPFFIAEYLRTAVAEGVLVRDRLGHWVIGGDGIPDPGAFEALPLPVSLHQLIELRLSKLTPAARRVLDVAALVGRTLETNFLQKVSALSEDEMGDIVDELVRRQIIEPTETDDFRFMHDKIREIADSQLTRGTRQALHRSIAGALEDVGAARHGNEDRHADLGHHWAAAGEPERAEPHLHAAARQAQRLHATAEAVRLFAATLRELEQFPLRDQTWRCEALAVNESLGDVLALQGDHAAARKAFAAAVAVAADVPVARARLHRKTGKTWEIEHAHENALAAYAKGEEALLAVQSDVARDVIHERIQIKLNRIWIFYWLNRLDEINAELDEVRPLIESHGLPTHRYHYFMSLVNRDDRRNRYRVAPQTLDYAERMVAAAQESGDLADIAFARFVFGFALLFAADMEKAEVELSEAIQRSRRIGDTSGETRAVAYLVILHRRCGRVAETRELAAKLMTIATKRRMGDYLGVAHAALGWCAWRQGDRAEARDHCDRALAVWNELPFPHPFQWTAVLTQFALYDGQMPETVVVELARRIFLEPQCRLPDAIDTELAAICDNATEDGQVLAEGGKDWLLPHLQNIIKAAEDLGYL
ncbi:protein kinase domain-containing protein [Telmatospirillum sp.]|uniref:serine/threonine-protein kinase n=1 Tax=Telmatospirillum sp. TaxID=2079197 RepID=UPI00284F4040|nr:protein kinase [Telmatospirillum sp.]MDR3435530.1 protein kinase [Telmatospirillum sp.]